ncbi:MAG: alpha/beta hydrolase family protein [Solirubrobacterales bacterium]
MTIRSGNRPRARVLALAIAAVAAIVLAAAGSSAASVRQGPAGLAFYHPPKSPTGGHGSLIWARKAHGLVPLSKAASTKLVLYTSTGQAGAVDAVSGSVSVPKGKPPKGGWPVITYAHGTTGTADVCAPSRNRPGDPATPYISYVDPQLNAWLAAGYAVVRTDYQGLGTPGPHPYLIGRSEGRSVLDIVRAARQLDPSIGKRFLIAGHSQGGHAALFAAGLASQYVPDLSLRGTVAYAPASHLKEQAEALPALTSPSGLTALAALIVQGATTKSTPSAPIDPNALLSDQVLAYYPLTDKLCLSDLSATNRLGGIAPSTMLRSGADTTALFNVLADQNPAVATAAPVVIAQGTADSTVFKVFTDTLVNELNGAGDNVTYDVFPGVDHGGIVAASESKVLSFFKSKLPPN